MTHTDIKLDGWMARLPESWRPYALLMRLDRPTGWMLLLLPGWWGILLASSGAAGLVGYDWFILILFFIGAVLMRGAGCIINDIWDRDIDRMVERTRARPLASGAVKLPQALVLLFLLLFVSFIILLQMPWTTVKLGVFSLLLIGVYPAMKRLTWWPQAFLGIVFNFGVLMGWGAILDDLSLAPLLLYASAVFWTIGYDTVYAHQDRADDALIGVKSTALLFGRRSKMMVCALYMVSFGLLLAGAKVANVSGLTLSLLPLAGVHLFWQVMRWQPEDAHSSLRVFQSNREYGLLVLAALALNTA